MSQPLSLYHARLHLISKQRAALDQDYAQVLAEAMLDGHSIVDLLDHGFPAPEQEAFDL